MRFDTEDELKAKLAENKDLSIDRRGNPLPRLAKALESKAKKERHRSKQEEEFLEKIIVLAHLHHWLVAHFRPARVIKNGKLTYRTAVSADGKGFPDLVLVREERVIVAEIKSRTGKVSKEQWGWLEAFSKTKVEVFCWHPADWDKIIEVLA